MGGPVGLDVVVDGTVPTGIFLIFCFGILSLPNNKHVKFDMIACCYSYVGSGLSSSAAFVCSATIAIMGVLGKNFPKVSLATNRTTPLPLSSHSSLIASTVHKTK